MKEHDKSGIGIISAVILIGMTVALIAATIPLVDQVSVAARTLEAREELEDMKIAMAGNANLVTEGGRTDFGYVGTMGGVPSQISDLAIKNTQANYSFDAVRLVGAGWIGPYVNNPFVGNLLALDLDPFGNPYVYTSTAFNRSSDSAEVAARILSTGRDGIEGTDDDMLIDVLSAEIFSTVQGTLNRNKQPAPFASVTLNVPVDGVLDATIAVTDSNGQFTFNDVPYGFRSLSIEPRLTYEDGTAKIQGQTLKFTITNFGEDDVEITSMTATYTGVTAYYEEVRFGSTTVFDYTDPPHNGTRGASGQTITFSTQTVGGSGKPNQIIPIRVDKEVTEAPDLSISGVGTSVVIWMSNFNTDQTGTGSNQSVSGAVFSINFSDGSSNSFTVP